MADRVDEIQERLTGEVGEAVATVNLALPDDDDNARWALARLVAEVRRLRGLLSVPLVHDCACKGTRYVCHGDDECTVEEWGTMQPEDTDREGR